LCSWIPSLEIFISSNSRNLLQFRKCVAVHVKEKGGKPDRKPHILPRNPYRIIKSENSQDYAQKPQRNCTFTNSASGKKSRAKDRSSYLTEALFSVLKLTLLHYSYGIQYSIQILSMNKTYSSHLFHFSFLIFYFVNTVCSPRLLSIHPHCWKAQWQKLPGGAEPGFAFRPAWPGAGVLLVELRRAQWGRRLEGWSNTAARLAGWKRVTRPGVILWFCMRRMDRTAFLFRTVLVAVTGAAQLRADGIFSCCFIVNVHSHPSWATSRKEGMAWYSSIPMPFSLVAHKITYSATCTKH
jgi:hypothetical protein